MSSSRSSGRTFAWGTGTTGASAVNLVSVAGQSMTPRSAAVGGAARRVAQPSSPRSYTSFQPDLLFAGAGAPPVDVVPSFERSRARRSGAGRASSSDESSGAGDDAGGIGLDDLASRPAVGGGTAGQGARSRSSQRINELHVNVAATPAPRPASIATAAAAWGLSEVPSTNSPRRAGAFAQHTHSSRSRRTASGERTARSTDRTNGRKPLRVWGKPKQKKGTFGTASTGRGESPRKKHTKSVGGVNHTCTTPVVLSEHALEKQFARGVVTHTCTACNERQHMFAHSGKLALVDEVLQLRQEVATTKAALQATKAEAIRAWKVKAGQDDELRIATGRVQVLLGVVRDAVRSMLTFKAEGDALKLGLKGPDRKRFAEEQADRELQQSMGSMFTEMHDALGGEHDESGASNRELPDVSVLGREVLDHVTAPVESPGRAMASPARATSPSKQRDGGSNAKARNRFRAAVRTVGAATRAVDAFRASATAAVASVAESVSDMHAERERTVDMCEELGISLKSRANADAAINQALSIERSGRREALAEVQRVAQENTRLKAHLHELQVKHNDARSGYARKIELTAGVLEEFANEIHEDIRKHFGYVPLPMSKKVAKLAPLLARDGGADMVLRYCLRAPPPGVVTAPQLLAAADDVGASEEAGTSASVPQPSILSRQRLVAAVNAGLFPGMQGGEDGDAANSRPDARSPGSPTPTPATRSSPPPARAAPRQQRPPQSSHSANRAARRKPPVPSHVVSRRKGAKKPPLHRRRRRASASRRGGRRRSRRRRPRHVEYDSSTESDEEVYTSASSELGSLADDASARTGEDLLGWATDGEGEQAFGMLDVAGGTVQPTPLEYAIRMAEDMPAVTSAGLAQSTAALDRYLLARPIVLPGPSSPPTVPASQPHTHAPVAFGASMGTSFARAAPPVATTALQSAHVSSASGSGPLAGGLLAATNAEAVPISTTGSQGPAPSAVSPGLQSQDAGLLPRSALASTRFTYLLSGTAGSPSAGGGGVLTESLPGVSGVLGAQQATELDDWYYHASRR